MKSLLRLLGFISLALLIRLPAMAQTPQLIYNGQFSGSATQVLTGATFTFNSGSALQLQFGTPAANKLLYLTNSSGNVSWVGLGSGLSISGGNLVAGSSSSANPTAKVGPTATNGTATTFMTSDSAPAINLTSAYAWTGLHTFAYPAVATSGSEYGIEIIPTLNQRNATNFTLIFGNETVTQAGTGNQYLEQLQVGGTNEWVINSTGTLTVGSWTGSVIGSNYGGAGAINGPLSGNGSGVVALATGGTGISVTSAGIAITSLVVTNVGASLPSHSLVLGNTSPDVTSANGLTTDGTSELILGVDGTSTGKIAFMGSGTGSGSITVQPVSGTLGTTTLTLPAVTGTLQIFSGTSTANDVPTFSNTSGTTQDPGTITSTSSATGITSTAITLTGAVTHKQNANSNSGGNSFVRSDNSNYVALYIGSDNNGYFDNRASSTGNWEFYSNTGTQDVEIGFAGLIKTFGTSSGLNIAGTTAASSTTTGSLQNLGGFGNSGAAYIGGKLFTTATTTLAAINVGSFAGQPSVPVNGDLVYNTSAGALQAYIASSWVSLGAGGGSGANPTASVGLSAVNGSATTFLRSDGAPQLSQAIAPTWTGVHIFSPAARSSGVAGYHVINAPADTGITASTEGVGVAFNGATRTWATTGTVTLEREYKFGAPTYASASASQTFNAAATVDITGAPIAGTNAIITNAYALYVESGNVNFSGNMFVGPGGTAATNNTIQLNGSSMNGNGAYFNILSNSTLVGNIGNSNALIGDGGNNLILVTPQSILLRSGNAAALTLDASSNATFAKKIVSYNGVATVGWGIPAIYGSGRATAQVAANASVATYTVGAADGTFEVSANILVTASVTNSFTCTCTYTDEGNTSRTLTLSFSQISGVLVTTITNVTGTGAYEGVPLHIRCKASTAITIATTGTFTSVTYNCEGIIKQES